MEVRGEIGIGMPRIRQGGKDYAVRRHAHEGGGAGKTPIVEPVAAPITVPTQSVPDSRSGVLNGRSGIGAHSLDGRRLQDIRHARLAVHARHEACQVESRRHPAAMAVHRRQVESTVLERNAAFTDGSRDTAAVSALSHVNGLARETPGPQAAADAWRRHAGRGPNGITDVVFVGSL